MWDSIKNVVLFLGGTLFVILLADVSVSHRWGPLTKVCLSPCFLPKTTWKYNLCLAETNQSLSIDLAFQKILVSLIACRPLLIVYHISKMVLMNTINMADVRWQNKGFPCLSALWFGKKKNLQDMVNYSFFDYFQSHQPLSRSKNKDVEHELTYWEWAKYVYL